jgi:DNA-binding NtrC family response regulator
VIGAAATPPTLKLTAGCCVIGSAPSSDIVITEPTVSRAHVELSLVPEGVAIRDLGSRNGTFYDGQRVEKMVLALGGRITVGAATVVLEADSESLGQGLEYTGTYYRGMVGVSLPMRRLFAVLTRLEGSLASVLIHGESGVGKELVARALHEGSSVSGAPFVPVNCGAIPRELVASELFGHRRGAFSGAHEARRGAFESADGGTLFLDEIGELPLEIQAVMLRALDLGEIRPVGDDTSRRVKVRVVAATNRNLETEVRANRFRQDLFYRLAVVRLNVPALRERPDDIEPLARRFAATIGLQSLDPGVIAQLRARSWPGNARELLNAIQVYAALGDVPEAPRIGADVLDQGLGELVDVNRPYADQKDEMTDRFTRIYLRALLAHTAGNQSQAAKLAGLNRSYLGKLLGKYGLPRDRAEPGDERD